MKKILLACSFLVQSVMAQEWQAEVMAGVATYNGDLKEKMTDLNTVRPAIQVNLKYEFYYLTLRAGLFYTQLTGNDAFNKGDLKYRNLNFRSHLVEFTFVGEMNLVEPDLYDSYPYMFAGVGVFYHNPTGKDDNGKNIKLQPLRTEGQETSANPNRKKYKLLQPCIPVGAGWKWKLNEKLDLAWEMSYRLTFTDYLDDVSTTYASSAILTNEVSAVAAAMSNRAIPMPNNYVPQAGDMRGNPKFKDSYLTTGVKLIVHLQGRKR